VVNYLRAKWLNSLFYFFNVLIHTTGNNFCNTAMANKAVMLT